MLKILELHFILFWRLKLAITGWMMVLSATLVVYGVKTTPANTREASVVVDMQVYDDGDSEKTAFMLEEARKRKQALHRERSHTQNVELMEKDSVKLMGTSHLCSWDCQSC